MAQETPPIPIWTALADAKRRQIISLLAEKPRTTGELCDYFEVSRFAVMKHLKTLEQAGLLESKRDGRHRWYFLNDELRHLLRERLGDKDNGSPYRLEGLLSFAPAAQEPSNGTATISSLQIDQTILLSAPPRQVFQALTREIDEWWCERLAVDSCLLLEPQVNGRFYEAFDAAGQGALYAIVTYLEQDRELRLSGSMGIAETAAISDVSLTLEPIDGRTTLVLCHRIVGPVDHSARQSYAERWHELLHHLKVYVEEGETGLRASAGDDSDDSES